MSSSSTLGMLYIDGHFACYTLEDAGCEEKVAGVTCIPEGIYGIVLQTEGGQNHRYSQKFPKIHRGMLKLMDIPVFEDVYLYTGNTKKDADGCILLGDGSNNNQVAEGFVSSSPKAYERVYSVLAYAIENGEGVWIEIIDGIPLKMDKSLQTNAVVTANRLNLRKCPKGEVEGILNEKTPTRVLGSYEGWSKIQIEGWVAEEFLEES